jgi:PilZ domain
VNLSAKGTSGGHENASMSERRRTVRQKSFLRGCIYFNNRRTAIDCLVRDMSGSGARLQFSDAISIPDVIELYIPQKEQTLRAKVERRHGMEVGVSFIDVARAPAKSGPADAAELTDRVQRLESEVAALRRMLRRLKADVDGPDTDAA